ncbi:uncharacterized protein LOC106157939 isoform X2 [Lingula anatina]|nr:uncharacterized protein LOC106157939 isoform X2 [Lingula anatina]|eukprot:XP_023933078.1 uncharacterized protein LOC106157939 isoform X2 [Lingula anatina]
MKNIYVLYLIFVFGCLLLSLSLTHLRGPFKQSAANTCECGKSTLDPMDTKFTPNDENSPQFVYLIQGASMHAIQGLNATPNREIIWLTFRDRTGDIYFPNSTHGEGRNRLLTEAIDRAAERKDGGYLYYVFLDDDVELVSVNFANISWRTDLPENPYDRFEEFLLDYEPAVGYPRPITFHTGPNSTVGLSYNFDAIINAFHRHTLSFLLPYITDLDHVSWWFAQWFIMHTSAAFYNSYRIFTHVVHMKNPRLHWHNKLKGAYTDSSNFSIPRDYYRTWFDKNKRVNTVKWGSASLLTTFNRPPMYLLMKGRPMEKNNMEYRVSTRFITTVFNTSHPSVQRIIQWRNIPM